MRPPVTQPPIAERLRALARNMPPLTPSPSIPPHIQAKLDASPNASPRNTVILGRVGDVWYVRWNLQPHLVEVDFSFGAAAPSEEDNKNTKNHG